MSATSEGRNLGSRFVVSLPVDREYEQAAPTGAAAAAVNLDGTTVLIVDDNRDAADSLGELLGVLGCECAVFYDGKTALDALEQSTPAIAFVDLNMPGIDGCQFAQRVRASAGLRDLRLVALTGWAQAGDVQRSAQAGFDRHLVKPIGLDQLTAALTLARER